jgi:predicted Zn-dependent protease
LEKQIDANPSADAYSALGQLIVMEGNRLKKEGKQEAAAAKYDEALTLLNRASTAFPDDADLNNELLNTYIAADRVTEAVEKFQTYADDNAQDAGAQYAAGTAMLQVNKFESAATYLKKSLDIDPNNESAMYNICVAYLRLGIGIRDADDSTDPEAEQQDYKSIIRNAIPYLQSLLDRQPDNASNWDLAGKIYATIGMTKEAGEAYEKADALRK